MSKIYFLFSIFLISLLFANCKSKNNNVGTSKIFRSHKTVISLKLKKDNKCIFNYCDAFFLHSALIFSNPGKEDLIVSKTVEIENPTVLFNGITTIDSAGKVYQIKNYFLVIPGDSINFSLEKQIYLKIDSLHGNRFLNDPYITYLNAEVYKLNKKQQASKVAWEKDFYDFYENLKNIKNTEKQRTDLLYKQHIIDSNLYLCRNQHTEILFYSYYFPYFFKSLKLASDIIKKNTEANGVMELLNSPQYIIEQNILDAFYGILSFNILNKKMNFDDQQTLFNEAVKLNITSLKPALLSSFLNNYTTDTTFFNRVTGYISKEYQGTIYEKNCNDLLEKKKQLDNIVVNDSLVELNHAKGSWNDVITSKKSTFILVDFWASWCSPCRAQMPLLHKAKIKFEDYQIKFISVNIDKEVKDWQLASQIEAEYLKDNNFHLTFLDEEKNLIKKMNINSIPRYILFKNGAVLAKDFSNPAEPGFITALENIIEANK